MAEYSTTWYSKSYGPAALHFAAGWQDFYTPVDFHVCGFCTSSFSRSQRSGSLVAS